MVCMTLIFQPVNLSCRKVVQGLIIIHCKSKGTLVVDVYCKLFDMEKKRFVVVEMKCNSVKNIYSCMVVLFGKALLYRTLSLFHWKLCSYRLILKNYKTFPPQTHLLCKVSDVRAGVNSQNLLC